MATVTPIRSTLLRSIVRRAHFGRQIHRERRVLSAVAGAFLGIYLVLVGFQVEVWVGNTGAGIAVEREFFGAGAGVAGYGRDIYRDGGEWFTLPLER